MNKMFKQKEGRFFVNVGGNFVFQGLYMYLAFWYSPFLLKSLGPSLFGLVPLITSLTAYLAIISGSIDSSVGRSLSMAIQKGDENQARCIVNTAFKLYLLITLLFLVLGYFAWNYLDVLIKLPEAAVSDAKWLLIAVFSTFCLTAQTAPFKSALFAHNLIYIDRIILVVSYSISVGVAVGFFHYFEPSLWGVAIGNFSGGIITAFFSILVAYVLMPYLRLSVRLFDREVAKGIVFIGGWLVVNLIGSLLYLKIDLLVVNHLFGPVSTGLYAIVLQLSNLLRIFSGQIISAFTPSFMYRMAENDMLGLFVYSRFCIRLLGVVMALLIGGMCGFGDVFLTLWVGSEYAMLHGILCIALFHLSVNISVSPLFSVQIATGNVRIPGIVTLVLGVVNLGLAIFLAGFAGWGLYGIASAGAIALTAKNTLFTPVYNAKLLNQPWYIYLRDILVIVTATFFVGALSYVINHTAVIDSWVKLIGSGIAVAIIYFPLAWFLVFNHEDRSRICNPKLAVFLSRFRLHKKRDDS
ncbi:oligosaccharide flippase family protein [Pontiellaceae bacterium B1224]|nr:oligosaccharide flippase family protein [Pontiellaceae bacterium B1224]